MGKTYLMIGGVFLPATIISLAANALIKDGVNKSDLKMVLIFAGLIAGGMLSAKYLKNYTE